MKKVFLGLAIASLLAGCAATSDNTTAGAMVTSAAPGTNLVSDSDISTFRANKGTSDVWIKHANKSDGKGDVGSSKVSAFEDEGSIRIRFVDSGDDFSSKPGVSQQVNGLLPNTDYVYSVYYEDRKGGLSESELVAGVMSVEGKVLNEKAFHINDLNSAPQGLRQSFRQASVAFNSGSNTSAVIYAKMNIVDASALNMNGDIGKETEVRVDQFSVIQK